MLDPLFWRWQDEYLILPWVRTLFGRAAGAAAWLVLGMAAGAAAEMALLLAGVPLGVAFGFLSAACTALVTAAVGLLLPWCGVVLLAERGSYAGRCTAYFFAIFCVISALCELFLMVTGDCLLAQQWLLPLVLPPVWLFLLVCHWWRMGALPVAGRLRLIAFCLFFLAAAVTDMPELLPLCALFKIAAAWAVFSPLRRLARLAPRVVGLPPVAVKG